MLFAEKDSRFLGVGVLDAGCTTCLFCSPKHLGCVLCYGTPGTSPFLPYRPPGFPPLNCFENSGALMAEAS